MGLLTRFKTVAAATWAAITQTGAALVITWTANAPTAGTTQTIADGDSPTAAETGQAIQNLTTQLNKNVVDIAAMKTALAASQASVALLIAAMNKGEG